MVSSYPVSYASASSEERFLNELQTPGLQAVSLGRAGFRINDPIFPHAKPGMKLQLGGSIDIPRRFGNNLDHQVRSALHARPCHNSGA